MVWVVSVDNTAKNADRCNKRAEQDCTPARLEVRVLFWREDAENVVVFVDGFAVVSSFLRIPPNGTSQMQAIADIRISLTSPRMGREIASLRAELM